MKDLDWLLCCFIILHCRKVVCNRSKIFVTVEIIILKWSILTPLSSSSSVLSSNQLSNFSRWISELCWSVSAQPDQDFTHQRSGSLHHNQHPGMYWIRYGAKMQCFHGKVLAVPFPPQSFSQWPHPTPIMHHHFLYHINPIINNMT